MQIVDVHFPGLQEKLTREALAVFFEMRQINGLKKKPSTSELLDWLKLLNAENIDPAILSSLGKRIELPPMAGALMKNEQDVGLLHRIIQLNKQKA